MINILTAAFIVYGIIALATSLHAFVTLIDFNVNPSDAKVDVLTVLIVGATWPLFWTWKLAYSGE